MKQLKLVGNSPFRVCLVDGGECLSVHKSAPNEVHMARLLKQAQKQKAFSQFIEEDETLKNLFQENAIPPWQRQAPLLFIDGQLIAVAGLGVSFPHLIGSGKRVLPEWQPAQ